MDINNDVNNDVKDTKDSETPTIKKGIPEFRKRANKKYAEANPEKLKAHKRAYYYRKKAAAEEALKENELLKKELAEIKAKLENTKLENINA